MYTRPVFAVLAWVAQPMADYIGSFWISCGVGSLFISETIAGMGTFWVTFQEVTWQAVPTDPTPEVWEPLIDIFPRSTWSCDMLDNATEPAWPSLMHREDCELAVLLTGTVDILRCGFSHVMVAFESAGPGTMARIGAGGAGWTVEGTGVAMIPGASESELYKSESGSESQSGGTVLCESIDSCWGQDTNSEGGTHKETLCPQSKAMVGTRDEGD